MIVFKMFAQKHLDQLLGILSPMVLVPGQLPHTYIAATEPGPHCDLPAHSSALM